MILDKLPKAKYTYINCGISSTNGTPRPPVTRSESRFRAKPSAVNALLPAPYGYIKDPDNPGHIIPDPDTKDIVIHIFREFLKDSNLKKIL